MPKDFGGNKMNTALATQHSERVSLRHDLMVELGRIEMELETISDVTPTPLADRQNDLESRKQRVELALTRLGI